MMSKSIALAALVLATASGTAGAVPPQTSTESKVVSENLESAAFLIGTWKGERRRYDANGKEWSRNSVVRSARFISLRTAISIEDTIDIRSTSNRSISGGGPESDYNISSIVLMSYRTDLRAFVWSTAGVPTGLFSVTALTSPIPALITNAAEISWIESGEGGKQSTFSIKRSGTQILHRRYDAYPSGRVLLKEELTLDLVADY